MRGKSVQAVLLCLALVAVVALAAAPAQAKKRTVSPRVIPPQAMPYGVSYGEWSARWWQWMGTTVVDPPMGGIGGNTGEGQSGPVWFLGTNYDWTFDFDPAATQWGWATADWTVTMPAGKALFVPLLHSFASDPAMSEAELAASAQQWIGHVKDASVTVDGRALGNLSAYHCTSSLFQLEWVAGNLSQMDPSPPTDSVSDGMWVMLAPLPVGGHVIHTWLDYDWGWSEEVTFHISVTPR
jgi:hypothetical protein